MLDQNFYGNTLYHWIISLSIIIGALLLNKVIILLNKHVIQKITAKTNNRLDDILFRMLEAPVLLGIILFAIWVAAKRLNIGDNVELFISKTYKVLTVINITWFISRLVNALIEEFWVPKAEGGQAKHLDTHLLSILRRTILFVIWALGVVSALGNAGYDVKALLGTLGIGGLAFALAAQDTIKNIFGGVTIFTDRPFRIGDHVKVEGFEGFIEDIGMRSTRLRTMEKRLVTIPNYRMVDAAIENVTDEPMRRILWKIGLTYQTTPEKMQEAIHLLKTINERVPGVSDTGTLASFNEFGDFAMIITFIYYIRKNADIMDTQSEVSNNILSTFNAAGLEFAYPTQTLYIQK